jgi:hypothetical protein
MKQTRLLEIIREEISEAVNALVTTKTGETKTMPYETPEDKAGILILKKDNNIKNIETTSGVNIKEGEKRKKLAEKYQLDEETINEMASIKQLKSELERQGKTSELQAVTTAEKAALDTLKADPTITSDGRLKGYVPTLKKELLNTHNIKLQDLLSIVAGKAEDDGVKFSSDIATNTIEKDAANQITGKEPGQRGRKASEKSEPKTKSEPKAKTEPKAKESKTDAGTDDEGNKVEIDTTVKSLTGDKEIEAKLKDVISKKKDKLKAALKSKDQETYNKEKAALKQFLEKPEIAKYIKKKTVDKVNPYTLSSIEDDIK